MENLTDKSLVKSFLGFSAEISVDNIIETISAMLIGATNRLGFKKQEYTETFYNKRYLTLSALPVSSITSIKNLDDGSIIPSSNYRVDLKNGVVELLFKSNPFNIEVKYQAGYLIDFAHKTDLTKHTLPYDLTNLATQLSAALFIASGGGDNTSSVSIDTNRKDIASESVEGQSITYTNRSSSANSKREVIAGITLSDFQMSILNKYYLKRINI